MSNLKYSDPFAPQPRSYGDIAGDYIHKARMALDSIAPSYGTLAKYAGPAAWAANGATQGDVLDNQADRIKAAYPDKFGGAQGPNALLGPATYPQTQAPLASGLGNAATMIAPIAATPQSSGPPVVTPEQAPLMPVSSGGYNAIDAAAAPVGNPAAPVVPQAPQATSPYQSNRPVPASAPTPAASDDTATNNSNALASGADLISKVMQKYMPDTKATGDGSWYGTSSVGGAPLDGYWGVTPNKTA